MPSSTHEAPLALIRERPALVAELVRDLLGVELPPFESARVVEADLTQLVPTEYRADLVIDLEGRGTSVAMVVEVQRRIDERKRYSWPLYAAAVHARRRCSTCLVVIAIDAAVAAWASTPIATVQPGSPFTPLVIGPDRIPQVRDAASAASPELAILSALVHGAAPDGGPIVRAALDVLPLLDSERATLYFDVLVGGLGDLARTALENAMRAYEYEYQSEFARKYFSEGREKGREEGREEALRSALHVLVAARLGATPDSVRTRIDAAGSDQLLAWIGAIGAATDAAAVGALLDG